MTDLVAQGVSVGYGASQVVQNIDLSARAGQVTAIVGPNGSGKSTLLKALVNELPYTGQITLNGQDIATLKPWQLAAMRAVLPQATPLAFPFRVSAVVGLGLSAGLCARTPEVAEQALAQVDMLAHADSFYQELSGGQQQRVQLARVLAQVWQPVGQTGPRWLFLDEPVASLDIAHQLQVMHCARRYADAGGGVITVMHDLNLTAMFADQVILIHAGQIIAHGSPDTVLTDACLTAAYGCRLRVNTTPAQGVFVLPHPASLAAE